jgi:phosphohistidine phosphatase
MNLFILRHALAVERGTAGYEKDADRPLTPKGERRTWRAADAMEALGISFDLILTSPYLRARQTAEIVAEAFKAKKKLEFSDELTPNGDPKRLIEQLDTLKPVPRSLLLVGHEPYLSGLISTLLAGDAKVAMDFKKGGLCKLEIETLRYGRCATLAWLLTPRQMDLLA